MKKNCRHAFGLAFDRGICMPGSSDKWLFLNACPIPDLGDSFKSRLECEQGFRTEYIALESQGYSVVPRISEVPLPVHGAVIQIGRNRRWNEYQFSRAWSLVPVGGRVVIAGNKTDGIGSLKKWCSDISAANGSFSKYHSVVFWMDKAGESEIDIPNIDRTIDGFHTSEGMFSAGKVDQGSLLLAGHFDERVRGRVADLGAGWGYLSSALISKSDKIKRIDLYEADYSALEVAKINMARISPDADAGFHWIDVASEFTKKPYDWVIMNPPFHTGRAADPNLGKRFIEVAASTLVSGGRLLMVANQNLPYEATIDQCFRSSEMLESKDGFKIIEAVR